MPNTVVRLRIRRARPVSASSTGSTAGSVVAAALLALASLGVAPRTAECAEPAAAVSAPPAGPDPRLALQAGVVGIASPGAYGADLGAGLRLRFGRYLAISADLGYGLAGQSAGLQDRWWLFPAVAGVLRAGPARLDLGVGLGVATSSGYLSWSAYEAAPFTPIWHFTVPALRAHLAAAWPVTSSLDLYSRLEVVSLLLISGPNANAELVNTLWVGLWLGIQYRLL